MKLYIAEPNANLAIGAVWANHSDSAKRIVLGSLDKLKDFAILGQEDIALLVVSLILNHVYNIKHFCPNCKKNLQLNSYTILL